MQVSDSRVAEIQKVSVCIPSRRIQNADSSPGSTPIRIPKIRDDSWTSEKCEGLLNMNHDQIHLTGASILLADDIPANLKVLRRILEPKGYQILLAQSGEIALRIARRRLPDLILVDVMMPDLNGYQVCRRLKKNESTQHIPVIFVTFREETENLA